MNEKAFSQACENNKAPILDVLQSVLANKNHVLEIGSGTGQHAAYFAPRLPHLQWQTSDLIENHGSIRQWLAEYPAPNVRLPLVLDVRETDWPAGFDAVFSANTLHIMAWPIACHMIDVVGECLPPGGVAAFYGPFNYAGKYTSESNASFDEWLKQADPTRGIRDFEIVSARAEAVGLSLINDAEMPANNRLLVFQKIV